MTRKSKTTNKASRSAPLMLSDAALVLLAEAAKRKSGMLLPAPEGMSTTGAALDEVLRRLLARDLVEEVEGARGEAVWREAEGSRFGLKITASGLKAIGIEEEAAPAEATPPPEASAPAAVRAPGHEPAAPHRSFRPGSKQARLVELLSREGGCTVEELGSRLGWLPHTVRAALTGLRQRGFGIERNAAAEGPSVYRIATPEAETAPEPAPAPQAKRRAGRRSAKAAEAHAAA